MTPSPAFCVCPAPVLVNESLGDGAFRDACGECLSPLEPKKVEDVLPLVDKQVGRALERLGGNEKRSGEEDWIENLVKLYEDDKMGFTELLHALESQAYERGKNDTNWNWILALGNYWPISGTEVDDLPKLAEEMNKGLMEAEREEERTKLREVVESFKWTEDEAGGHKGLGGQNKALDRVLTALSEGEGR